MAGIFLTNQLHHLDSSRTCGKKMADNNSTVVSAAPNVGQMTEDVGPTDPGDDDDPLSENQDHAEETMFISQTAPPENQCVSLMLFTVITRSAILLGPPSAFIGQRYLLNCGGMLVKFFVAIFHMKCAFS